MEGTSGAADLGLLRGRTSDAALGGIASKVGVSLRPKTAIPRQEVSERIGLGRSSCACMPSGGPLREVPLRDMLAAEAIGPWPVKPRLALAAHSPMATFGVARSRVMLEGRAKRRPSAAEFAAKAVTTRRRSRSRSAVGASRRQDRIPGVSLGFGGGSGPRGRKHVRRAKRASASSGCSVTWGSVDSQVVLADCLYCRSRRAAFGPLPPLTKAREGLAHRRSTP